MHVMARSVLTAYWCQLGREDSEQPLKAWFAEARAAAWAAPADIQVRYPFASLLADNRVMFNIGGDKHRLVVHVHYDAGIVLIKFVGSRAEYDAVDATSVGGGGKG